MHVLIQYSSYWTSGCRVNILGHTLKTQGFVLHAHGVEFALFPIGELDDAKVKTEFHCGTRGVCTQATAREVFVREMSGLLLYVFGHRNHSARHRAPRQAFRPRLQDTAEQRFTKPDAKGKARLLRHRQDRIFDSACMFFDQEKRRCKVYEVRPGVCRKYPDSARCGYYDFLSFEREQQGDEEYVART